MDQKLLHIIPPEEDDGGIDFIAILQHLWKGRKTVILCTCIFFVLGLVAAITMKRTYTVSTTLVPQMNARSSSFSSLAALAGFDLGTSSLNNSDLSPLVYPHVLKSASLQLDLLYTPYHFEKVDTAISFYNYQRDYNKPSVFLTNVKKYTIGLPRFLMGQLNKVNAPKDTTWQNISSEELSHKDGGMKPILLTEEEAIYAKMLASSMSLTVDKKEGYLTLAVKGSEPLQTAEMAIRVLELLQSEITKFRTEKAEHQLQYIQARYDEVKAEMELYQNQLAGIRDRSQQVLTTRSRIEQDRVQTKFAVASSTFAELAKQLEAAKMQVKRDTPTITVVQPITVPRNPSNSRARKLIVWTFLGIVLGCGIVLGKEYLPKLKELFKKKEERAL